MIWAACFRLVTICLIFASIPPMLPVDDPVQYDKYRYITSTE